MQDFKGLAKEFRIAQIMMGLINSGFRSYLEWSPAILLSFVGVLTFCAIRYWNLPFYIYAMFPSCGIRCLAETMVPLAFAGYVYDESRKLVHELRSPFGVGRRKGLSGSSSGYMRTTVKSFKEITCSAGSLFKFQQAIVLTCTTNTVNWTLNLLILFK